MLAPACYHRFDTNEPHTSAFGGALVSWATDVLATILATRAANDMKGIPQSVSADKYTVILRGLQEDLYAKSAWDKWTSLMRDSI